MLKQACIGITPAILLTILWRNLQNSAIQVPWKVNSQNALALPEIPSESSRNYTSSLSEAKYYQICDGAAAFIAQAQKFAKIGKVDKARKLYEQATKLCPQSAIVWHMFGLFLEQLTSDSGVVEADSMYRRALSVEPGYSRSIEALHRVAKQVDEVDRKLYERIARKHDALSRLPSNDPLLRKASRESYYLHIYHTNALEGNSFSLGETRSVLDTGYVIPGKTVKEHNEVLGLHSALKYINSTLVTHDIELGLSEILEIHRRVLSFADPDWAGRFRDSQVYIGGHVPPSPHNIEKEMTVFLRWLASDQSSRLHPIEFAALAHYWLVYIHPFEDGNGRTSRLLMNALLMRAGYPPVTIQLSDRLEYYDMLRVANRGDVRPFVRFIARCTERTLDRYIYLTRAASHSDYHDLDEDYTINQSVLYLGSRFNV